MFAFFHDIIHLPTTILWAGPVFSVASPLSALLLVLLIKTLVFLVLLLIWVFAYPFMKWAEWRTLQQMRASNDVKLHTSTIPPQQQIIPPPIAHQEKSIPAPNEGGIAAPDIPVVMEIADASCPALPPLAHMV